MTTVNTGNTAVVVVDMQNDFAHPDGALYSPHSEEVIPEINNVVEQARDAGADVVFTRDVHSPEQFDGNHYYDEFEQWGEHVVEGSWGAGIVDGLTVEDDDSVVEKHTYDAFSNPYFSDVLQNRGVDNLVFTGTLANVCVLHTAGTAGLRDYRPVLVEDAIGFIEEDHRDYALEHADWLFGEVTTSDELSFR